MKSLLVIISPPISQGKVTITAKSGTKLVVPDNAVIENKVRGKKKKLKICYSGS